MRYLIESISKESTIGAYLRARANEGKINILEKGDPVEQIKEMIRKISRAFETLKAAGIDEDVMIAYIKSKGISKTNIDNVLFYQKEFLKKLGV